MNDIETDIKERREKFLKAYGKLREEYQIDFASFPVWVPNDRGSFETVMNTDAVDLKYRSVKSPISMVE